MNPLPPTSNSTDLRKKLQEFLPKIKESNEKLLQVPSLKDYQIECNPEEEGEEILHHQEEQEGPYIEMNIGVGVFEKQQQQQQEEQTDAYQSDSERQIVIPSSSSGSKKKPKIEEISSTD